jgi:integrase
VEIKSLLLKVAQEKGLRQSTVFSYRRLLTRLQIVDDSLTLEEIQERLLAIDNVNSRRAAAIACRSILNLPGLRIPKGVPRRYDLPSEDTLRMALMMSRYEIRGLIMMYAGLRLGESCAITAKSRRGDRLHVDRQVTELYASAAQTGGEAEHVRRLAPVKTNESDVIIPHWLCPLVDSLDGTDGPGAVRTNLYNAGQKLGIALNPHQLRHWYCTTALARGVPLILVSKQMRHSDVAVTLRSYSQSKDEDIHEAFG